MSPVEHPPSANISAQWPSVTALTSDTAVHFDNLSNHDLGTYRLVE